MAESEPLPDAIAGVDIGGTKVSALLVDDQARVLGRASVRTPVPAGGPAIADAAATLVGDLAERTGVRLCGIGVGAAGVVDSVHGVIVAASDSFTDWAGFRLADELGRRTGVPVYVENDVNAFLIGEASVRPHEADLLGIMLGTGVGGALLLDGRLRHGPHGSAGEIGHTPGYSDLVCTCGQLGHLETLASGRSIGLRYGERTGITGLDAVRVAERARNGDEDARAVFAAAGRAVALACVTAAGLVELSRVVVGGGVIGAWDLMEPAILITLATDSPVSGVELTIEPSRLGADAVALGVAASVHGLLATGESRPETVGVP